MQKRATMDTECFKKIYDELNFCYEQNIFHSYLTDEITGELDIEAYKNKEIRCFRKYDITTVPVKKTIVLSNNYFNNLDLELKKDMLELFARLMETGHKI